MSLEQHLSRRERQIMDVLHAGRRHRRRGSRRTAGAAELFRRPCPAADSGGQRAHPAPPEERATSICRASRGKPPGVRLETRRLHVLSGSVTQAMPRYWSRPTPNCPMPS